MRGALVKEEGGGLAGVRTASQGSCVQVHSTGGRSFASGRQPQEEEVLATPGRTSGVFFCCIPALTADKRVTVPPPQFEGCERWLSVRFARMGVERAGRLLEMLFAPEGEQDREERDRVAVHYRDELEGALVILQLAGGRGATLRSVLKIVDDEARRIVEVPHTELTWAVALVDPDAWWGSIDADCGC